ncbi:hypothetical protein [Bacillus mesophilum]|uniref:Uncharacterized protein n=1 Tax=Bacillus mesophilum TaxID=1071718 RepID=A0A7V7UXV5_9BACI|nr:hypothetical protein [Bacillus mesophilum]KAB2332938.1 hypothetical protein F7732_12720 [Bacillus mesophilum]
MVRIENAHHGTSKEAGTAIVCSGEFLISTRPLLWLGDGAYFFNNDKKIAKEWCISEGYKKSYVEYTIIEARININTDEEMLDLNKPDNRKMFHAHREIVRDQFKKRRIGVKGKTDFFDGQIINDLCKVAEYKVVMQDMFIQLSKDRILKTLSRVPNCTVISVRDTNYIEAPKIVEEGVLNG